MTVNSCFALQEAASFSLAKLTKVDAMLQMLFVSPLNLQQRFSDGSGVAAEAGPGLFSQCLRQFSCFSAVAFHNNHRGGLFPFFDT